MSNDYADQMVQWILDQASQGQLMNPGPYEGKPAGITAEMQRRTNLYQDQLSTQSDMANAALTGPSAFAPGAFQSTSTYTPVEQPGTRELTSLAQRMDTPLGMIAAGILRGSTASAEIAKLQQMYNEAKLDGSLATDPLLSQIPTTQINDLGDLGPDWDGIGQRMNDVESSYMQESQGAGSTAMYDANTGEYLGGGNQQTVLDANGQPMLANVETTPSEAAQWYADQGLSPPDQQYGPSDFMTPGWEDQDYNAQVERQNWFNSSDALNALYAQMAAEAPTGKTQFATEPPVYGKGGDALGKGGGGNAQDGVVDPVTQQTGAPDSWWSQLGIPAPEQNVSDIVSQIQAEQQRFGYPGMNEDLSGIVADAAAQGNDVSDIINPWNAGIGGQTGPTVSPSGTATPATANLPQHVQDMIAQAMQPAAPAGADLIAQAAANGNDVSDLNVNGYGGGFGGGGQYGFQMQPQMLQQLMPQNMNLGGLMPQGGNPPGGPPVPPPGRSTNEGTVRNPTDQGTLPGGYVHNGAIFDAMGRLIGYEPGAGQMQQPQYNTPGQAAVAPGSSGPPMPTAPTMGIGGMSDTLTPPATPTAVGVGGMTDSEAPIELSQGQNQMIPAGGYTHNGAIFDAQGRLVGYLPGSGQMQQPEQQYTPPTVGIGGMTDSEAPIEQSQGQNRPQLPGGTAATQALIQALLSHSTASSPPQSGLPQSEQPGRGVNSAPNMGPQSEQAGRGIFANQGPPQTGLPQSEQAGRGTQAGYGPSSWWQQNMGPTSGSQQDQGSWWQENMTPSWWSGVSGGGGDQQVRIGAGKQSSPQTQTTAARRSGPSKRGRASTPATQQGWREFWDQGRRAGTAANQAYGADYGHAAAVAYLLQQQGITPSSTQVAARRAAANSTLGM